MVATMVANIGYPALGQLEENMDVEVRVKAYE